MYKFSKSTHVDVVEDISYENFKKQYLSQLKPVIIKDGIASMPAVGKWDLDYLDNKIGKKEIELDHHHSAKFKWSMEAFFIYLRSQDSKAEKQYLTQANIVKYFPGLLDDLSPYPIYGLPDWKCNSLLPRDMFYQNYQMELLMGKKGTGFFLHYDRGFMNAFVGQICGEKEVVLLPPSDKKYLYPLENEIARAEVDIWNVDEKAFPEIKHASPAFYTLQPGDLVYIPANWWHTTRNKTFSIGVTFNSINKANWKMFSQYILSEHKKDDNTRYPTIVVQVLLKVVGVLEGFKDLFSKNAPRQGDQREIWEESR